MIQNLSVDWFQTGVRNHKGDKSGQKHTNAFQRFYFYKPA